jgi:hypothetical protein
MKGRGIRVLQALYQSALAAPADLAPEEFCPTRGAIFPVQI